MRASKLIVYYNFFKGTIFIYIVCFYCNILNFIILQYFENIENIKNIIDIDYCYL